MNVVIADDEDLARSALVGLFRTCLPEVEVVGEASDGEEAYQLFVSHKPDILVLDIKMPGENGLDVAAKIRKISKDVCIIILTAYDSFDFAQRAVNTQVNGYLLKPVEKDELVRIVTLWELEHNHESNQPLEKREELKFIQSFAQAEAIQAIFQEETQKITQFLPLLGKTADNLCAGIFISSPKNPRVSQLRHSLEKNERIWLSSYHPDELILLFFPNLEDQKKAIQDIAHYCNQFLHTPDRITKVIIHPAQPLAGYSSHHLQLLRRAGLTELPGVKWLDINNQTVVPFTLFSPLSNHGRKMVLEWVQRSIEEKQDEIKQIIQDQLSTIQSQIPTFSLFQTYCIELLVITKDICSRRIDGEILQQFGDYLDPIIHSSQYQECKSFCTNGVLRFLELIAVDTSNAKSWRLHLALEYIHGHLADDLFLDKVAEEVEITPQHLSKLFRDELDTSFNQYLTDRRIEKAKFLLYSEPWKVAEVAQMVGYKDSNYFSKVFRKCTGVNPNGYRNALTNSE